MQPRPKGAIPLPNHRADSHACASCALQEARGGRICPAAREQGLPDVAAERHAATLYAAVLAEAQGGRLSLAELVSQEVVAHHTGIFPASIQHDLAPTPTDPSSPELRREVVRVAIPARIQR